MSNRKEEILIVALHLFARDGYEAVSVSQIAGELDMTKGALYRHYKSKRDIFDCIMQRMEQQDGEQAAEYDMPEEDKEKMPERYETVSLDDFVKYSKSMFEYWTEDDFASSFRKMLTIEQFRSEEMQNLYQQYLVSGPTEYVKDLFDNMEIKNPEENAVKFYANMFFYYSMYDGATDKTKAKSQFERMLDKIVEEMKKSNIMIRLEKKEEYQKVENLVRESFWNVYRPGCLEHYVLHQLRNDPAFVPELDFVMFLNENGEEGKLIGQNMFMRTAIKADDGRNIPIMTMGPICITPELKRQGYGKALLDYSLDKAAKLGYGAVCFEGNIDFYGKSGFRPASEFNIRYHGLDRLLVQIFQSMEKKRIRQDLYLSDVICQPAPNARRMLEIPEDHYMRLIVGFGYPEIPYVRGVQKNRPGKIHRYTQR